MSRKAPAASRHAPAKKSTVRRPAVRRLTPISCAQYAKIELAIVSIEIAIEALRFAECPLARKYVQRALKSVEGAKRHALRRPLFTPNVTATR